MIQDALAVTLEYLNNYFRWGSEIKRSKINQWITRYTLNFEKTALLYREVDELHLTIIEDVNSVVVNNIIEKSVDSSWESQVRTLVSEFPELFKLEDVYLFEREFQLLHPENHNVRAKIRQMLQLLREANQLIFISNGLYRKAKKVVGGQSSPTVTNSASENEKLSQTEASGVNDSESAELDIDDDFDDLATLLSSEEFQTELAEVQEIVDFKNNSDYIQQFQQDRDSAMLANLFEANQGLVNKVVSQYSGKATTSFTEEDMFVEGNFGLMRAIERFDLSLGNQFSTYAVIWIRQAITRAIADQSLTVRLPVHMQERIRKLTRVEYIQNRDLCRLPTNDELAAELDEKLDTVLRLKNVRSQFGNRLVSLEQPVSTEDDNSQLGNFLPDDNEDNDINYQVNQRDLRDQLEKMLATLSDREANIIRLRFGMDDGHERTLEEVGKVYHVTRERIRQIEAKAMRKLKKPVRMKYIEDWDYQELSGYY